MRVSIVMAPTLLAIALVATVTVSAQSLPDGNVERGRAIAAGAFAAGAAGACQSCHGIDGAGDAAAGFPRLSGMPREYLAKSLSDYATGKLRNEIMEPIAEALREEGMIDVATFYATTAGTMTAVEVGTDPAQIQRGGIISAIGDAELGVQACQNCHGPNAQGMGFQYPLLPDNRRSTSRRS